MPKQTSFRHALDITPWDKGGHSFWGLTRQSAKRLGLTLIFLGAMLSDPPGGLLPNDFINFIIAEKLTLWIDGYPYLWWLTFTYTVLGWGLILVGAWVYPYNTKSLLNGYMNKFKKLLRKLFNNPAYLALTIIAFLVMFKIYKTHLAGLI